jgi:hypothetical protein
MPRTVCWIVYLDPAPLLLTKIAKDIPCKISSYSLQTECLKIDDLGKIQCWGHNKKEVNKLILDTVAKIEKLDEQIEVIAIGEKDQKGKTTVFVRNLKHITNVLAREVELIVRDLGLSSQKTQEVSYVVANEMLSNIAIKNKLNTGLIELDMRRTFSGCFVINEKLVQKMTNKYIKTVQKYATTLEAAQSSSLRNLVNKLGEKKNEILTAVAVGLISEAAIRIIIYIGEIMHRRASRAEDIKKLGLPEFLLNKIKSKNAFSVSEVANILEIEIWQVVTMLNTLVALGVLTLFDEKELIYKGTDRTTYHPALGAFFPTPKEKIVASKHFHEIFSMKFDVTPNINWTPDQNLKDLYESLKTKNRL